jgi:hypothetical protein
MPPVLAVTSIFRVDSRRARSSTRARLLRAEGRRIVQRCNFIILSSHRTRDHRAGSDNCLLCIARRSDADANAKEQDNGCGEIILPTQYAVNQPLFAHCRLALSGGMSVPWPRMISQAQKRSFAKPPSGGIFPLQYSCHVGVTPPLSIATRPSELPSSPSRCSDAWYVIAHLILVADPNSAASSQPIPFRIPAC